MSLQIQEIPSANASLALLLLADPSESKIRAYLPQSRCFATHQSDSLVAVCTVQMLADGVHELMSIAVPDDQHRRGYGSALLRWVINACRSAGAQQLVVGTGSFGYQLAFYQRHGFHVTSIARDFLCSTTRHQSLKTAFSCATCCD